MADIPDKQVKRLRILIQEAETNLAAAKELLLSVVGEDAPQAAKLQDEAIGKVIEGVFDGQNMVGSDGKIYPVPANYASKSKLVQGDILKLTIAEDGTFLYKQIGRFLVSKKLVHCAWKPVTTLLMLTTRATAYSSQVLLTSRQSPAIK